jgi:catechol 2,3-dioxygenase-like lactoylglutathione lyase family enzyme
MALHPNGVHHLAISTCDVKAQIEFFTDVLGGELKALYWMHGVADTFHAFIELNPSCSIAFVQHPKNTDVFELGVTHAGNAGGPVAAGTMQHVALSVDTLEDLLALRDRIRSRGVVALGPMNHGMCQSLYFAGPEGLCLEIATGSGIDERAWIDPEVTALAGITDEDLARYIQPADFDRPATPVPQPPALSDRPHLTYPPPVYAALIGTPDEVFWTSMVSDPPVEVTSRR